MMNLFECLSDLRDHDSPKGFSRQEICSVDECGDGERGLLPFCIYSISVSLSFSFFKFYEYEASEKVHHRGMVELCQQPNRPVQIFGTRVLPFPDLQIALVPMCTLHDVTATILHSVIVMSLLLLLLLILPSSSNLGSHHQEATKRPPRDQEPPSRPERTLEDPKRTTRKKKELASCFYKRHPSPTLTLSPFSLFSNSIHRKNHCFSIFDLAKFNTPPRKGNRKLSTPTKLRASSFKH
jgi:hypothetical protein